MEPNNRELALLIWIGALLIWALTRADMRRSLGDVAKAFLQPAILVTSLGYVAWTVGLVFLASSEGLWNPELAGDTVLWAVTSYGLLFASGQILDGSLLPRHKAMSVLQATILVEVFVNLAVFPLWVELFLLPVLALLTMAGAMATARPDLKEAEGPINGALSVIGVCLVSWVIYKLATDPDLLSQTTGLRFLLPCWLLLGLLPYIYLLAVYAGYDSAFRWINFKTSDRAVRRKAKWDVVRSCGLRAQRLGEFKRSWPLQAIPGEALEDPVALGSEPEEEQAA